MREHSYATVSSDSVYDGAIITVRRDVVRMPGGGTGERDVVGHPGAVGVVALDSDDRVLLIRQYRHPVGRHLWELPAGLLDQPGEPAPAGAARELAEEAGLRAREWATLVDAFTSPGMTDEVVRVYLARGIEEIAAPDRHQGRDEEAELRCEWVPLGRAADRALAGEITNAMAVQGLLAADRVLRGGPVPRSVDAPWP